MGGPKPGTIVNVKKPESKSKKPESKSKALVKVRKSSQKHAVVAPAYLHGGPKPGTLVKVKNISQGEKV